MSVYLSLFFAFVKVGLVAYGGGPSMLPLISEEVVTNRQWVTMEEFTNIVGVGNTLPGPIATKTAAYVGYKVAGVFGALCATLGMALPTAFLMLVLAVPLLKYGNHPRVRAMMTGIRAATVALVAAAVFEMSPNSLVSVKTGLIGAAALVAMLVFRVHPAVTLVAVALVSLFFV